MLPEGTGPFGYILQIAQGDQKLIVVDVQGLVGLHAHDGKVDRPQPQLRQDAGQDGGDSAGRVEHTGRKSGQHARQNGTQQGEPYVVAGHHHHDAHGASCTKGAVHRQIGDIQQLVGDIHADGHDAPDQPLGYGAGECVEKARQFHFPQFRRQSVRPASKCQYTSTV